MQYKKKIRMIVISLLTILCAAMTAAGEVKAEEKKVTAKIPVSCTGENTDESFVYLLEGGHSEYEKVAEENLTLKDGEKGFFVIDYTYPGTYHYTIQQKKGTDNATTYDGTVYNVDVYVTENESGVMSAEPVIYVKGSAEKKAEASFVNSKKRQGNGGGQPQTENSTPGSGGQLADGRGILSGMVNPKTGDSYWPELLLLLAVLAFTGAFLNQRKHKKGDREDAS